MLHFESLCGRSSCLRLTGRFCPACERESWFLFYAWCRRQARLNERRARHQATLFSQARAPGDRACPPGVNPKTGEISEPRAGTQRQELSRVSQVREVVLGNLYGRYIGRREAQRRASLARASQRRRLGLSFTTFVIGMSIIAFVLAIGAIINGSQIIPSYEHPPVNYPPLEWMWDRGN